MKKFLLFLLLSLPHFTYCDETMNAYKANQLSDVNYRIRIKALTSEFKDKINENIMTSIKNGYFVTELEIPNIRENLDVIRKDLETRGFLVRVTVGSPRFITVSW